MKRIFAVLLVAAVLLGIPAYAESVDLKSLSDRELLSLYESVRTEMAERGITAARSLRAGTYIIGEDILPGTYLITCTGTEAEALGDAYSSLGNAYGALLGDEWGSLMGSLGGAMGTLSGVTVQVLGDYGTVLKKIEMKTGDRSTIALSEGTALKVSEGSITIEVE